MHDYAAWATVRGPEEQQLRRSAARVQEASFLLEKNDDAAKPQVNETRQLVIPVNVILITITITITIAGERPVDKCSRAKTNSQNGVDLEVDFAAEGDLGIAREMLWTRQA
jgi:3-deoxy-D-arabino-heptulosonate 7-phosphate (DAHP) synthase class II